MALKIGLITIFIGFNRFYTIVGPIWCTWLWMLMLPWVVNFFSLLEICVHSAKNPQICHNQRQQRLAWMYKLSIPSWNWRTYGHKQVSWAQEYLLPLGCNCDPPAVRTLSSEIDQLDFLLHQPTLGDSPLCGLQLRRVKGWAGFATHGCASKLFKVSS